VSTYGLKEVTIGMMNSASTNIALFVKLAIDNRRHLSERWHGTIATI